MTIQYLPVVGHESCRKESTTNSVKLYSEVVEETRQNRGNDDKVEGCVTVSLV